MMTKEILVCTDEWGTHHSCSGCPHNQNMGDCSALTAKVTEDGTGEILYGVVDNPEVFPDGD